MDDLGAAWITELYYWWKYYNTEFLGGALRRPVVRVSSAQKTLGTWNGTDRVITIAAAHIGRDPWLAVLETLRHEMAHQYAEDVLDARDEPPHGPAFRRACELLRVTPRASRAGHEHAGHPGAQPTRHRLLGVIAKLLSLAGSPNRHEADAAIRKARHLLLKHNIELVEVHGERTFGVRQLGPVKGRHQAYEYTLAGLLNEFFFVRVIWVASYDAVRNRRGTVLQVYGTDSNLEMADYVHSYLSGVLDPLWRQYRASRGIRGDRERMRYFEGVLQGFRGELRRQEVALRQETALVPVEDAELTAFFRRHNPRIRTVYGGSVMPSAAYRDGTRDGRKVTVRRPLRSESGGFGGYLA